MQISQTKLANSIGVLPRRINQIVRVQGVRPIIQHQAIGAKLADIANRLEAARSMIWKAAWVLDHPGAVTGCGIAALPLDTAAREFTAETMRAATENAAECFGAMGVMLDNLR